MAPKKKTVSRSRKTSKVPTRNLTFRAFLPRDEAQDKWIRDEIYRAHRYDQALRRIENTRRARFQKLLRFLNPRIVELDNQRVELEARIQELRRGLKKKAERDTPEQLERIANIKALGAERNTLWDPLKAEKRKTSAEHFKPSDELFKKRKKEENDTLCERLGVKRLGPNNGDARNLKESLIIDALVDPTLPRAWKAKLRIDTARETSIRRARSKCGCYSGTYLAIEDAVNRAAKDSPGKPLKYRPFEGTGKVRVQLTKDKGLPIAQAFAGTSTLLKMTPVEGDRRVRRQKSDQFYPSHSRPVDPHAKLRAKRAKQRRKEGIEPPCRRRVAVTLRGVKFEILQHRPIPSDAVIKWAALVVKKQGYQPYYELLLTVESNKFPRPDTSSAYGTVAINFGYRVETTTGQVRIATTYDGQEFKQWYLGNTLTDEVGTPTGEVLSHSKMVDTHRNVPWLLSRADRHFDNVLARTIKWFKTLDASKLPMVAASMPRKYRDVTSIDAATKLMARWRSHKKLLHVVNICQKHLVSDEVVQGVWDAWLPERKQAKRDLFSDNEAPLQKQKLDATDRDSDSNNTETSDKKTDPFDEICAWLQARGISDMDQIHALYLTLWRRKEIHLVTMARRREQRLREHRRDAYRKLAMHWARRYEKVIIDEWDMDATARNPSPEADVRTPQEEKANSVRQFAGISVLRQSLAANFREEAITKDSVDSGTHFRCGGVLRKKERDGADSKLLHSKMTCTKCRKAVDQDLNRAKHLWAKHCERISPAEGSGTSRKKARARKKKPT